MSNQRNLRRGSYGGASRLALPGQVNIQIIAKPGPWASPAVAPITLPDGSLNLVALGGLTREEHIAAPIMAALAAADSRGELSDSEGQRLSAEQMADVALTLAETLLAVSQRRAIAAAEAMKAKQQTSPVILGG